MKTLNFDILTTVFSLVEDPRSLTVISETSHLARKMVLPLLLEDVHLTRDIKQVQQLCKCVAVDSVQRAACINTLRISCADAPSDGWEKFAEDVEGSILALLKDACNIQTLILSPCLGIIASQSPKTVNAIATLPRLMSLVADTGNNLQGSDFDMIQVNDGWLDIICATRNLRTLHLSGVYEPDNLTAVMDLHWTMLKEVAFFSNGNALPFSIANHQEPCFSVDRLVLHDFAQLRSLSEVFPNVRSLTLRTSRTSYDASVSIALDTYKTAENVIWESLDHLVTDVVGLSSAVIGCSVCRLDVDLVLPITHFGTADRLYTIFTDFLRDSTPAILTLRTDAAAAMTVIPHLHALCPQLRCLRLIIVPYGSLWLPQQPHTMAWLLESIVRYLAHMPALVYISLDFRFHPAQEPSLRRWSIGDNYAAQCFSSIASLQYIKMTWPMAGLAPRWWAMRNVAGILMREFCAISGPLGMAADKRCTELVAFGAVHD
ncbi:hypothetical protein B0H21DRAFT_229656 [Amylocystis lapponica]|nr:hypothetical protein B0H21DRAFT_229656 [Amylocystis lapponica]